MLTLFQWYIWTSVGPARELGQVNKVLERLMLRLYLAQGTNEPTWAITTTQPTARMYVDLPPIFGPVTDASTQMGEWAGEWGGAIIVLALRYYSFVLY